MIYITLDTCIWSELIKIGWNNDNSVFEEICFWIENKYLTHITPENMIREWDRNKSKKLIEISKGIKQVNSIIIQPFKATSDLITAYEPDKIDEILSNRMDRVDAILKVYSEKAEENEEIYKEAIKRNVNCLAPNHIADSFRDTINIFTIMSYIKSKGYTECIFSTINSADFSEEKSKKHDLHNQLVDDFKNANLQYVYCDEQPFAHKLLVVSLRPFLPSFQDYLIKKKREQEDKILAEKKHVPTMTIANPDADYLENIRHLDIILAKKTPTAFEQYLVKILIGRHDSYRQYFFRNLGNDGLV